MSIPSVLRNAPWAAAVSTALILPASLAVAGGGLAIGKIADDLTARFNKAASPSAPPPKSTPRLEHRPPVPVPGGTQSWSTGQVPGTTQPLESAPDIFNRGARDYPASEHLTDVFNHARRLFD
ncbi:MAG: hypothetical protein AAFU49_12915 [Pseudomonadota bacterium]